MSPKTVKTDDPSPSVTVSVDRKLAAAAFRKTVQGEQLNSREISALKRYEKEQEEKRRWQYYRSIPQKHWRSMSGRQTKVLHEQASLYGIPFGGATVNLPEVVMALHDFLAENARKLARDEDALLTGPASPFLEEYRKERAALARLDRLERENALVSRAKILEGLARVATIVRGAGDSLQRQFGSAALDILLEALDEAEREIERSFQEPPPIGEEEAAREPGD